MIFNMGGGITPKQTVNFGMTWIPGTRDMVYGPETYLVKGLTLKGDENLLPENIKKGVTIFRTEGTYEAPSSGLYAWKKSLTAYHTFEAGKAEITFTYSRGYHYKLSSANFDLSQIDNETYVDILDGFEIGNVKGFRIAFMKSGRKLYYTVYSGTTMIQRTVASYIVDTDGSVNIFLTGLWSASGQTVGDSYTAKNTTSKTLYSKSSVGYAIADELSKYPDGGVVDGYFYELVKEEGVIQEIIIMGMVAENFGMTEIDFGEFTHASLKNTSEYTINHNLGTKPKFLMIFSDAKTSINDEGLVGCMVNTEWVGGNGMISIDSAGDRSMILYTNPEAKDYLELTNNTVCLKYGSRIMLNYKAGVKYRWIVGV